MAMCSSRATFISPARSREPPWWDQEHTSFWSGTIDDDLILDLGSQVDLNGTVLGNVYNRGGNLHIAGTVLGSVYRVGGYTAIGPGAEIEGDVD